MQLKGGMFGIFLSSMIAAGLLLPVTESAIRGTEKVVADAAGAISARAIIIPNASDPADGDGDAVIVAIDDASSLESSSSSSSVQRKTKSTKAVGSDNVFDHTTSKKKKAAKKTDPTKTPTNNPTALPADLVGSSLATFFPTPDNCTEPCGLRNYLNLTLQRLGKLETDLNTTMNFLNGTYYEDVVKLNKDVTLANRTAADALFLAKLNLKRARLTATYADDAVTATKDVETQAEKDTAKDETELAADQATETADQATVVRSFLIYGAVQKTPFF